MSPQQSVILGAGAISAQLTQYAPGCRQADHDHESPHVSIVLSGALVEISGRDECQPVAGWLAMRPAPCRHSVAFGSEGAVILTLMPPPDTFEENGPRPSAQWRRPQRTVRPLVRALFSSALPAREDLLWDLFAAASAAAPRRIGRPPAWATRARERLLEDPGVSIEALARAAGRHRVSFSRAFEAWYGVTPRTLREQAMLDRSLRFAAGGVKGAEAAAAAGFADQSHMNRCARKMLGTTPLRLAALLG